MELPDGIQTWALGDRILNQTYGHWTAEWWEWVINHAKEEDNFIFQKQTINEDEYKQLLKTNPKSNEGIAFGVFSFYNSDTAHSRTLNLEPGINFLHAVVNDGGWTVEKQNYEKLQNSVNHYMNSIDK